MAYVPNELLSRLAGCRLYSVQFVMDYVQLWFDSHSSPDTPVLNCDVLPTVTIGDTKFSPTDLRWADALRSLIPQTVTATRERTGLGLQVEFPCGELQLHPTLDEIDSPEIAMLSGFEDKQWMVWRPGEDSFEDLAG